jgi:hypothetical protein
LRILGFRVDTTPLRIGVGAALGLLGEQAQNRVATTLRLGQAVGAERLPDPFLPPAIVNQRERNPPETTVLPEMVIRIGGKRAAGGEFDTAHT